ncbi:MAG: hypothetical protein MUP82_10520, partial [Candidatus Marinimicrobia bacterium]|nr:hypothetical protein [Candidatus Neomarinimicrobiota bacterium]
MALPVKTIFVQFTICLLLASCSGTRHLPQGEKLYTGAEINLESADHISHRKKNVIETVAENAVRPKLWLYMIAGENPRGKLKKWLKKIGEAPVLISSVKPTVT